MAIYQVEPLIHDIQDLRRQIKSLTHDVSLTPTPEIHHRVTEDLRALIHVGHELRGFIGAVERQYEETLRSFAGKRRAFITADPHYKKALKNARTVHKDDSIVIRELAVSMSATQHVLEQRSPTALWEGVRHLLHELKHLESLLLRLKHHLEEQ